MTRTVAPARKLSKKPTRTDAGRSPHECGWFFPIVAELKDIFERDCAAEVAMRAARDIKTVERWLSGKVSPDGEALARLLRSDIGDRIHDALITGVQAAWAKNHRTVREIARLRQQQADAARRLAALEGNIES